MILEGLLMLALSTAAADRALVDSVAAVVERRVVTTSELVAEARLVLLERAGPGAAATTIGDSLLQKVLEAMVLQELLALEARRNGVAVREVEVDRMVAAVAERFPAAEVAHRFFEQHGIDEELLRGRARRDLSAQALLGRAFSDVHVTDAEAEALLEAEPLLGNADAARSQLEKQRRDARFQSLVAKVKEDVEIRVVWRP